MASDMHPLLQKDIRNFTTHCQYGKELAGSTFLITGITGLIGSILAHSLLSLSQDIRIIAPIRNKSKALAMFDRTELAQIHFIECDLCAYDYNAIEHVDYIIHCAAPTSSRYLVEHAVETSTFIYNSTQILLQFAQQHPVKSFVFLSSLEVYGQISDDTDFVTEDIYGYIDPMISRSSYPMAKLAAENLCCLYAHEYGVPAKIARLTQTTGVGVSFDDDRAVNQFARKVAFGEDIVLHTRGESAKPYCYTLDAIDAILTIMLRGKDAEAYNVANDATYISIRQLAEYFRDTYAPAISLRIEIDESHGYAPETRLRLSSAKLAHLGWASKYNLKMIFDNLIPWLSSSCRFDKSSKA